MKNLQDFQLGLHSTKTSDSGFEKVILSLQPLAPKLHSLSLHFGKTNISDSSIKTLAKEIMPKMKVLNNLTIYMKDQPQISDSSVVKLFSGMEKTCQSLKNLALFLGGPNISDKTVEALRKSVLSRLNGLETLNLDLANSKVKDSGMVDLIGNMGLVLEKLRGFTMILSGTNITDLTIFALNKQLMSSRALERFKLNLAETQVTNGVVQEFCQIMTKYCNSEKLFQSFDLSLNMANISGETFRLVNETRKSLLGMNQ